MFKPAKTAVRTATFPGFLPADLNPQQNVHHSNRPNYQEKLL